MESEREKNAKIGAPIIFSPTLQHKSLRKIIDYNSIYIYLFSIYCFLYYILRYNIYIVCTMYSVCFTKPVLKFFALLATPLPTLLLVCRQNFKDGSITL